MKDQMVIVKLEMPKNSDRSKFHIPTSTMKMKNITWRTQKLNLIKIAFRSQ